MTVPFRLLEVLYADEEMQGIWSGESSVSLWLRVEAGLAQAKARAGMLTASEADEVSRACSEASIDVDSLWVYARNVGYPILGLVRQIAEQATSESEGRVHFGATTQDIMDSALAMQLAMSCDRMEMHMQHLGDGISSLVETHALTVMAARTHGQQAVPTTFGAKMAVYLDQVQYLVTTLRTCRQSVAVVSLYGAGGTNAAMGPAGPWVRAHLARELGLGVCDVPWHAARYRVAAFGQLCALAAATCVRLAREVIDLARNEIGEVSEEAGHHRGASSTMPQKANPVLSESIIGFGIAAEAEGSTLVRSLESSHERSSGEWQLEWLLVPQVAEHTSSALQLAASLVSNLSVHTSNMTRNLRVDGGLLMSEALMMHLASEIGRERAHDVVYEAAKSSRITGRDLHDSCRDLLEADGLAHLVDSAVSPADYIGESAKICGTALAAWRGLKGSSELSPVGGTVTT